jgi:hypothetical protein
MKTILWLGVLGLTASVLSGCESTTADNSGLIDRNNQPYGQNNQPYSPGPNTLPPGPNTMDNPNPTTGTAPAPVPGRP